MSDSNQDLVELNSATLGAKMPEITLPNGSKIQTGTIGALLINIKKYNAAHARGDQVEKKQLESTFWMVLPLLHKAEFFHLFPQEDWIRGENEGRREVGKAYLEWRSQQ